MHSMHVKLSGSLLVGGMCGLAALVVLAGSGSPRVARSSDSGPLSAQAPCPAGTVELPTMCARVVATPGTAALATTKSPSSSTVTPPRVAAPAARAPWPLSAADRPDTRGVAQAPSRKQAAPSSVDAGEPAADVTADEPAANPVVEDVPEPTPEAVVAAAPEPAPVPAPAYVPPVYTAPVPAAPPVVAPPAPAPVPSPTRRMWSPEPRQSDEPDTGR